MTSEGAEVTAGGGAWADVEAVVAPEGLVAEEESDGFGGGGGCCCWDWVVEEKLSSMRVATLSRSSCVGREEIYRGFKSIRNIDTWLLNHDKSIEKKYIW